MKKILPILMFLFFLPSIVHAETGKVPFSIQPLFPDNQSDDVRGYFDLQVKPGDEENIHVKLFNSTDKEIKINVSAHPAATNSNGIIVYDGSIDQKNHSFNGLAEVSEKVITLSPRETYVTQIHIKAPKKSFDGEILGGLYFLEKPEQVEKKNLQINNNYAYALAVRLHEADNKKSIKPEMKLKDVGAQVVDHRTAITAHYSNEKPVLMSKMNFKAEIYKANSNKPLFAQEIQEFSVAPDVDFSVPMMLDNKPIEPGKYFYRSTFTDGEKKYKFEKTFTIEEKQAEKVNNEAIELVQPINWWLYISIALVLVITLLVGWVIRLNKKTKE